MLRKLLRFKKDTAVTPPLALPPVVAECTAWLKAYAMKEEGLFRIPAAKVELDALAKHRKRKGGEMTLKLTAQTDPHLVAGFLKQFIRDLEHSLLTEDLAVCWLDAMRESDASLQLSALRAVVDAMPMANRVLAAHLFHFLHVVAAHAVYNRMTAHNLAIVFGPNLMMPTACGFADSGLLVQLAFRCISTPRLIFDVRDDIEAPQLSAQFSQTLKRQGRKVMMAELTKQSTYEGLVAPEYRPSVDVSSEYVRIPDLSDRLDDGIDDDSVDMDVKEDVPVVPTAHSVAAGEWRAANCALVLALAWSASGAVDWPLLEPGKDDPPAGVTMRTTVPSRGIRVTVHCTEKTIVRDALAFLCGVLMKEKVLLSDPSKRFTWALYKTTADGLMDAVDGQTSVVDVVPPLSADWPRLLLVREELSENEQQGQLRLKSRMAKRLGAIRDDPSLCEQAALAHAKPLPATPSRRVIPVAAFGEQPKKDPPQLKKVRAQQRRGGGSMVMAKTESQLEGEAEEKRNSAPHTGIRHDSEEEDEDDDEKDEEEDVRKESIDVQKESVPFRKPFRSPSPSRRKLPVSMTLPRIPRQQIVQDVRPLDLEAAQWSGVDTKLVFTTDELVELVMDLKASAVQLYICQLEDPAEQARVKAELLEKLATLAAADE